MDESKQEIVNATHEALKKHGYSELSIQKIADEFEKSKSLLYHHYDSKDEILLDFMDHVLEGLEECCLGRTDKEPEKELMNKAFIGFGQDQETIKAMVEIRAQAIRDKRYRERFQSFTDAYHDVLTEILEEGKKKEVFEKDVDVEKTVKFIDAVNKEAMFTEAEDIESKDIRSELENYIEDIIMK